MKNLNIPQISILQLNSQEMQALIATLELHIKCSNLSCNPDRGAEKLYARLMSKLRKAA